MATIVPAVWTPTLCWIAPLMPHATYSAGLTILPVWPICWPYGDPAGIDRRAGGADRAAERVGEVLDQREALRPGDAPSAADDDARLLDRARPRRPPRPDPRRVTSGSASAAGAG